MFPTTTLRSAFCAMPAILMVLAGTSEAAPAYTAGAQGNAGVQLNRTQEYLERQERLRQLQQDREASRKAPVRMEDAKGGSGGAPQVSFAVRKIQFDDSLVLSPGELSALAKPYEGAEKVTLEDLYALVEAVNRLYHERGFLTCRAALPPQRVHDGAVRIRLVEGRTGTVQVKGNAHTHESYILRRVPVAPGEVANINELTDRVLLFNGTNDASLRVELRAGAEPGTTDYDLVLQEPPKNWTASVFADNNGFSSNGRYRAGVSLLWRSVTGHRDSLSASYLKSHGSDVFGAGYRMPVPWTAGTWLDFDFSANRTEVVSGELEPLGVKGRSTLFSVSLRHPFVVDRERRVEGGLQLRRQKSSTDLFVKTSSRQKWVRDTVLRFAPYVSHAGYGASSIFYHRHSLNIGHAKDIESRGRSFQAYSMEGLYQRLFSGGKILQLRMSAQVSLTDKLVSSEKFYLGGNSTVRGYEESLMGAESGVSAGAEFMAPLWTDSVKGYVFADAGALWGDSSLSDRRLASLGAGLRLRWGNWLYADLAAGFPLKRTVNGDRQDSVRAHLLLTATY